MEIREIYYDESLACSYCNRICVSPEDVEFDLCKHSIFVATEVGGFEYISEDISNIITHE